MHFEENLIQLVSEYPELYDRDSSAYRSSADRAEAWKKIAAELCCDEEKATRRWKSIRDRYVRELRRKTPSDWSYFDMLHFLAKNVKPKSEYAINITPLDPDYEDEEHGECKRSRLDSPVRSDDDMTEEQEIEQSSGSQADIHQSFLNTIKMFQDSLQTTTKPEDSSYGVMVADMLTTLPARMKAEAKLHILQYLTEMQFKASEAGDA